MKPLPLAFCILALFFFDQCPSKKLPPIIVAGKYDCRHYTVEITYSNGQTKLNKYSSIDDARDSFIGSGLTPYAFEDFKASLLDQCSATDSHPVLQEEDQSVFLKVQEIEGVLTFTGEYPVAINGQSVPSNSVVKSNSIITVPPGTWATVDIGVLGSLQVDPGTRFKLTLASTKMGVQLEQGCVKMSTRIGVSGEIVSKLFPPKRTQPSAPGFLTACVNDDRSPPKEITGFVAKLTTRNNQAIQVNDRSATTGASVLSNSTVETSSDVYAKINLGPMGTLDVAPNTKLTLTYEDKRHVKALIHFGCAILTAKKNVTGEVTTEEGSAGLSDPISGGVLNVCLPLGSSTPIVGKGIPVSTAPGASGGGLFSSRDFLAGYTCLLLSVRSILHLSGPLMMMVRYHLEFIVGPKWMPDVQSKLCVAGALLNVAIKSLT